MFKNWPPDHAKPILESLLLNIAIAIFQMNEKNVRNETFISKERASSD
jgi:hypothetical protein